MLLLDTHTDVMVWSGADVAGPAHDGVRAAVRAHALALARGRFPAPRVMQFREGASMARWLQARLVPTHQDSPQEQMVQFPALKTMAAQALAALRAKFTQTDDMSFSKWYRNLGW